MTPTPITPTSTTLNKPSVWIARIGAGVLAVFTFIIILGLLPLGYNNFTNPTYTLAPALRSVGLSAPTFAVYYLAWEILGSLIWIGMGLWLLWRKSESLVGLLVAATLITYPGISDNTLTFASSLPILRPLIIIISSAQLGLAALLLYTFPDGKIIPPWGRWVLIISGVWLAGVTLWQFSGASLDQGNNVFTLVYSLGAVTLRLSALSAQIYRYFRVATATQRQQTKWWLFGQLVNIIGVALYYIPTVLIPPINEASEARLLFIIIAFPLTILLRSAVPIGLAFAITRNRLWEIDFYINRSLVYGSVTSLLGLVFLGGILILQTLLERLFGAQSTVLAAIAATVVVVALFAPTRRYLKRFIDRHLYKIEIDYQTKPPLVSPKDSPSETWSNIGDYHSLEFIGRGGMAEVYKSTLPSSGKPVAIKILFPHLSKSTVFRQRFIREADVMGQLQHPNIVRVFEHSEQQDTPYMVLEYLNGNDLGDFIKTQRKLTYAEAEPLIQQIAAALDYAHQQGLIHRDIKPSNIMLDISPASPKTLRAVLTDFGIAKITNNEAYTSMTQTNSMLGTFDYIAPEQIQASAEVDRRADIYALGVMAYQMFTGELPFKNANPGALLIAHLTQPPPNPREIVSDLPYHIASAIQRAMSKKPDDRFATATEFAKAIR